MPWISMDNRLEVVVSRQDIFGTSVREQFAEMLHFKSLLHRPFKVIFQGEAGIDEGALSMDFFRLAFEELLDPQKHDLVRRIDEDHPVVWFQKDCRDSQLAEIFGLLFGLSLYNKAIVPLPFPQLLYAKLLGKGPKNQLKEVRQLDKDFADQMSKLLDGTEEYIMGCCYGDDLELAGGRSVEVTKENVHLYVEKKIQEFLVPSQFKAFQRGVHKVFRPADLEIFRPIELETLVIGEKYYDWKALEESTKYEHPYTDSHVTIKMFWQVFHALDDDMKRKFLVFVVGSDRVPVGGLKNIGLHIECLPVPCEDINDAREIEDILTRLLPTGHGCDNHGHKRTLRLPMYSSLELVEDRLTVALSFYDCPFHIA
nr:probable E3 ubiquitin-protein ligase HERC4 [Lytechinus pictus]